MTDATTPSLVFQYQDMTIALVGDNWTGKESLYVNDQLVSEKRNFTLASKHTFQWQNVDWNFAFRLKQGGSWGLAPAYDVCHAYRPGSVWVSEHALSINNKRIDIKKADLIGFAKAMNVKKPEAIIAEINSRIQKWNIYADESKVGAKLRDAIKATLLNFE